MNDIILTVRTNKNLKERATEIYKNLGMNLSTAINMFLKETVIKKTYPCDINTLISSKDAKSTYPKGYFKLFGANNLLISAIVMSNNGVLVTHNTNEFSRINGLKIEDWTE